MGEREFGLSQDELMTLDKILARQQSVKETQHLFPVHPQPTQHTQRYRIRTRVGTRALSPVSWATLDESVFHFKVYLNTKAPHPLYSALSLHLFIHMSIVHVL